ncbi:ribonuclease H-like domain-containing protein [Tanacetum coccineum]
MRNKPDIDEIDIDDLYNNLRVYEDEMKRSSSSTSTSQNLAFLSSENTSSTNEVSTASGDFGVSTAGGISQVSTTPCAHDVACSFFAQPTTSPQLENEDFQQIDEDDLEELDLRWQALVAQDGLGGYDWSNDFEVELVNYALMAISSSSSSSSSDNEVQKCSKQCLESFKTLQKNYDSEREKHSRARLRNSGYSSLESLNARILGLDEYAIRKKIIELKTTDLNTKTSETVDDEDDVSEEQTVSSVKTNETLTVKTRIDKIGGFGGLRKLLGIMCPKDVDQFMLKGQSRDLVIGSCSVDSESQVVLRAPRKDDVYSLDLKNIVPSGDLVGCDNGTEFKNHAMNEFCAKKGIKREFSVARTPQQNGVAERKNRTLIEAARTMLADSLLPILIFGHKAVNTPAVY